MKFEGGVHRVQRVPKTEKQGRIHTSTMTVAILPQPTEVIYLLVYLSFSITDFTTSYVFTCHIADTQVFSVSCYSLIVIFFYLSFKLSHISLLIFV